VLSQGNTPINGPHQGALVEAANGTWWFVHFQDAGFHGRIESDEWVSQANELAALPSATPRPREH